MEIKILRNGDSNHITDLEFANLIVEFCSDYGLNARKIAKAILAYLEEADNKE